MIVCLQAFFFFLNIYLLIFCFYVYNTFKGKVYESSVKMEDLRKLWSYNESFFCRAAHVLLGYSPTYHSFIAIPDRTNDTLAEDGAELQAQHSATPRSRQKAATPSRCNIKLRTFLVFFMLANLAKPLLRHCLFPPKQPLCLSHQSI